jgi:hypothetical protein
MIALFPLRVTRVLNLNERSSNGGAQWRATLAPVRPRSSLPFHFLRLAPIYRRPRGSRHSAHPPGHYVRLE